MPSELPDPTAACRPGSSSPPPQSGQTLDTVPGPLGPAVPAESYAGLLSAPMAPDELGWLAHYRVLKVLGRGGMGMVFQAEDTHLRRIVALKVILPEFAADPLARERFLREARAAAGVKNDHVVTIYQVGQDRDIPFLAMEFLEGQSLADRLGDDERLAPAEVLRIGRQIADGLAAAHAHGLIHRDIKPANIWLEAPTGRVKLLDFGLARPMNTRSELTQTGNIVGTPEFMSPEQARGEPLDARTDLFSLGAVLYAMCSGRQPFEGSSTMAILTALAVATPPPVRSWNPAVPPALEELVQRLLEKEPAKRPASANEVRDALAAIEAGTPVPLGAAGSPTKTLFPGPTWEEAQRSPPTCPAPGKLRRIGLLATAGVLVAIGIVGAWLYFRPGPDSGTQPVVLSGPPIRVGILHSRTGTMAISERPVIDAVHLAIEEINAQGGLLGRPVEAVLADGQSDEAVFARQAEKLIREERVCTLFGCWTSASRKAVVPVVERHDHLLFYPVQYEGVEESANVVYGGPVPNQQILPALRWLVGFEGKRRWFLVGSDYVFPVTANAVIRDEARKHGCEIVGETYLLLGSTDVADVVKQIARARPDLIVNTINGDTNVAFFRALRRAGIKTSEVPTLSVSISEEELSALGPRDSAGDYVAANYFHSLDTPQNQELLARFGRHYGRERVISSAMATAYAGVHLWASSVRTAGRDDPRAIRAAVKGQTYAAPHGFIRIDPGTQHTVQAARVGRINDAGRVVEVYVSPQPITPEPYPASRRHSEWESFLKGLYRRWGNRWSNPGDVAPSGAPGQ